MAAISESLVVRFLAIFKDSFNPGHLDYLHLNILKSLLNNQTQNTLSIIIF